MYAIHENNNSSQIFKIFYEIIVASIVKIMLFKIVIIFLKLYLIKK
jgi:hypothetical protein